MARRHVIGDLQVSDARSIDGWCWMPEQPTVRVAIEILVDETVVAQGEAALPRPDLAIPGMLDKAHGFWLQLPPGSLDGRAEALISARACDGGVVFGRRRLQAAPGAWNPRLAALRIGLGELSEGVGRLSQAMTVTSGARWRDASAELADLLAALADRPGAGIIDVIVCGAARRRPATQPRPPA